MGTIFQKKFDQNYFFPRMCICAPYIKMNTMCVCLDACGSDDMWKYGIKSEILDENSKFPIYFHRITFFSAIFFTMPMGTDPQG